MTVINKMTICGFRGVLASLSLNFSKNNFLQSMVIYGRNGTGKSSITDAWEWVHTEKIMHLAREGAGPGSYPHKNARPGESYVEVEFNNDILGTVRIDYDHNRITKPRCSGNISQLRQIAPHPCHIRFEDLTRFVYLTKTERFDALAQLMGFTPQVELQKSLRRVSRKFKEEVEKSQQERDTIGQQLCETLDIDQINEGIILDSLNKIFLRHNSNRVKSISDVSNSLGSLVLQVENDPRAKELAQLKQLNRQILELTIPTDLITELEAYSISAKRLSDLESDISDLLLLGLYEKADEVFTHVENHGRRLEICPLCNRPYEGDLHTHITNELEKLKQLKQHRDDFDSKRKDIRNILPSNNDLSTKINELTNDLNETTRTYGLEELNHQIKTLEASLDDVRDSLEVNINLVKPQYVNAMMCSLKTLKEENDKVNKTRDSISSNIVVRIEQLEKDESRRVLVTDQTKAQNGFNLWDKYQKANKKLEAFKRISKEYDGIVNNFVRSNIINVQSRFDVISSDVQKYFSILEQDTEGLGKPKLKLLPDEDRAVELEVEFYGEPVYPAYRFLSASQLNSFGLAIFLASAKFFNKDFRFLVLDDVINSFDGYKRPKVIDLLKQELSDHQILLFTHDSVWSERLFEAFPTWIKRRFARHEIGIGPIDTDGYSSLEIIEQLLDNDEPTRAGRELGPLLERHLQELCESFEVLVKYNQRNEYTLDPLLDRFRVRVKDKLGKHHELYGAVENLKSEAGFRNLCAHWKNPDIELTYSEMKAVVDKWKAIELIVRCRDDKCYKYVRYDGVAAFVCPCGRTQLEKI